MNGGNLLQIKHWKVILIYKIEPLIYKFEPQSRVEASLSMVSLWISVVALESFSGNQISFIHSFKGSPVHETPTIWVLGKVDICSLTPVSKEAVSIFIPVTLKIHSNFKN